MACQPFGNSRKKAASTTLAVAQTRVKMIESEVAKMMLDTKDFEK